MKNILILLLLSLGISTCAQAPEKEGLLWKISGKDLKQPSYLFGTAHGFSGEFLNKVNGFWEVFDSIQQLVVEMDTANININRIDSLMKFYEKDKFLPEGVKYPDLLDKNELHTLDSALQNVWGINSNDVKLRPRALYDAINKQLTINKKLLDFSMDSIPENNPIRFMAALNGGIVMDVYIMNKAKEKGYKIVGLETVEYQMKLKMQPDIPLTLDAKSLVAKLKNRQELMKILGNNAVDAIFTQDLKKYIENTNLATSLSDLGDSYINSPIDEIKKRNLNWIPMIELLIQKQPSMIAVGVGHLPEEYGLINLLRQRGYEVEQVK